MTLTPRAAAIRGDDYQHAIGWFWACEMLRDPDIETVTIEDPAGGSFDDVLVRRREGANTCIQAKSSTYGNVVVDNEWLVTAATTKGRSPLQHFHDTYVMLAAAEQPFMLEFWTNRGFDHENPLLGKLLDQKSDHIDTAQMLAAGARSAVGKERDSWAEHLRITTHELAEFLDAIAWKQTGSEIDWRRQAKPLMELAGLRADDDAVTIGISMARRWVTDGAGPRSANDVRAEAAANNLLALTGTLLLAVHGIDTDPTPTTPNVTLDFVDLYDGEDPFSRKLLKDEALWATVILPSFNAAARTLASYRVRNVHVAGSLRHPMWFAAGRALPEVKKWVVSLDQVGAEWRTDAQPEDVTPRTLASIDINAGGDLAFAVGLTGDPTEDVERCIRANSLPVGRLLVIGPEGKPARDSVPSDAWAMGWTRAARDVIRKEAASTNARLIHLFMLCPAGIALMLGHQWNVMPDTTIYEFDAGTYRPTITFPGS